jgi:hypothetical protein
MATQSNVWMALSFLLIAVSQAWTLPQEWRNESDIVRPKIRVDDQAGIKPKILENAKMVTGEIFLMAGVELQWLDCSNRRIGNEGSCSQPLASGEIALHLARHTREQRLATGTSQFGYAARKVADGGSGGISIFYEFVEQIAGQLARVYYLDFGRAQSIVLGHFMAHEIGHLLLPNDDHSVSGIMKSRLDRSDWALAVRRHLQFTQRDAELIRQGVQARSW